MKIGALLPHALLLAVPAGWFLWRYGRRTGVAGGLRIVAVLLSVMALAQPVIRLAAAGSDLVVLVDRSASMPPGSDTRAQELIQNIEQERRPGDRVAVVGFGARPEVEQRPTADGHFGGFTQRVDPDSSNLAAAIEKAAELVPAERKGSLFVISDGQATGGDLAAAAQRIAAQGMPVSFRALARAAPEVDVAVLSLDLPSGVPEREPFQFSASVYASKAMTGRVRLERDGHVLAEGPHAFTAGEGVLLFRDRIDRPGLAQYRLTLTAPNDGLAENDVGVGLLRVLGADLVVVMSRQENGALARTLSRAGIQVAQVKPGPLSLRQLEGVSGVVLEDIQADALTDPGIAALAQVVELGGAGLVMTGGQHSFGQGGYRKSALEDVLPVSLEMRQEQRRAPLAMVIMMDCSGSMGVTLPDGRTKMRLAGEGAVAALTLLGEADQAAVYMVDTVPHEIVRLQPVTADLPLDDVARGFSGGGGILVGEALRKARSVILGSSLKTRHIVLFADASDATDPEDYKQVLAELRRNQVTVSVIGMGTEKDGDAPLLKEVAKLGNGRVYFAESAASLPRVFSQETMVVAHATFVEKSTPVRWTPDLALLGPGAPTPALSVDGYNLTYLKPQASVGLRTDDDAKAPLVAFWPSGMGKAVAFATEVDGTATGPLRNWSGYTALLNRMVRWSLPAHGGEEPGWTARASRQGSELRVTVDFGENTPPPETPPSVVVLREGSPPGSPVPLRWEGEGRMGLRLPLGSTGSVHPIVRIGDRAVRLAPVTLPYSQEFAPARNVTGKSQLEALARATGGTEKVSIAGLFRGAAESEGEIPLAPYFVAAGLLALLFEVYARRALLPGRRRVAPTAVAGTVLPQTAGTAVVEKPSAPKAPVAKPGVEAAMAAARRRIRK